MTSNASSSEVRRAEKLDWYYQLTGALWYYMVTLTLCRIGHKPKMVQRTKTNGNSTKVVSAELSCRRCHKVLDFQTSILVKG